MSWLRKSGWKYSTGAGGGASIEFVMASGGDIILTTPDERAQSFYYGGVGVGLGVGLKLPRVKLPKFTIPEIKVPKLAGRNVGGAGSTFDFPSGGLVFMTSAFRGEELSRSDLQGATVYLDGSAGAVVSQAGTVMLLGINSAKLAFGLTSPSRIWMAEEAIFQAPALLYMHGRSAGLQAGFGAGVFIGYMH